jgi:hypothetical protein
MQKLYAAANLQEAHLLLHRLQQAGIEARVLNEHAQGGLGELPFTHVYPEIWLLHPEDSARAARIVEDYEGAQTVQETRVCAACGETNPADFEVCWRCQALLS